MVYKKPISGENPNKCKSKKMYTVPFCQKFLTQLKSRILTIKIGVIFLYKNLCFFADLCQAEQVLIFLGI